MINGHSLGWRESFLTQYPPSFHGGLPLNCRSYWYEGLSFWSECTVGLAKAFAESAYQLNSPSVQSCFFHFTSVSQVLISIALPISSYTLVSWKSFSQGTPSSNKVEGCVVQPLLWILPSLFSTRAQVCVTAPKHCSVALPRTEE